MENAAAKVLVCKVTGQVPVSDNNIGPTQREIGYTYISENLAFIYKKAIRRRQRILKAAELLFCLGTINPLVA
ncbi:hypothetical protein ACTXT7_003856 [Hymenolepis weldensis]